MDISRCALKRAIAEGNGCVQSNLYRSEPQHVVVLFMTKVKKINHYEYWELQPSDGRCRGFVRITISGPLKSEKISKQKMLSYLVLSSSSKIMLY